eukprot:5800789-Prymnesium_polylepis.1
MVVAVTAVDTLASETVVGGTVWAASEVAATALGTVLLEDTGLMALAVMKEGNTAVAAEVVDQGVATLVLVTMEGAGMAADNLEMGRRVAAVKVAEGDREKEAERAGWSGS